MAIHHQLCRLAQPWPQVLLLLGRLEPAEWGTRQAMASPHRDHPARAIGTSLQAPRGVHLFVLLTGFWPARTLGRRSCVAGDARFCQASNWQETVVCPWSDGPGHTQASPCPRQRSQRVTRIWPVQAQGILFPPKSRTESPPHSLWGLLLVSLGGLQLRETRN